MRYLVTVSYRGTSYCGWQKQTISKLPSIEETIERVLSRILNTPTKIYASGRTDAGVHALGQTFHFDTEKEFNKYRFLHSLNELLPLDIRVLSLKPVDKDFHARFNAKGKTYVYQIRNSNVSDPFKQDQEYTLGQELNVEKMVEASKVFEGEHNFKNFTSKDEDKSDFVREITGILIKKHEDKITITITGNGFMRYMVRMIVGTLLQVGLGKLTTKQVEKSLYDEERKPSSYKAPACGLYLKEVIY